MAATCSNNTFHRITGRAEGNWHGKRLTAALNSLGYVQASARQADILIAHPAGCYSQQDDCWISPKPCVELIQTYHA